MRRRAWLAGAAALPLAACRGDPAPRHDGGWVGAGVERGHALRDWKSGSAPAPSVRRRAGAIVVGGGVAGLGAARALLAAGIDDVHVFELEDAAGGNARGHAIAGMGCPLGAHYLPLPGESAVEVAALLESLGAISTVHGRVVADERMLCQAPQERLYLDGFWHAGLLPPVAALPAAERGPALAQYRRFAAEVARRAGAFAIPTARAPRTAEADALDALTFDAWLAERGFDAPALRWYLDYCCRDDYGAGAAQVSAWAGLHYFASRHGFHPPGEAGGAGGAAEAGGTGGTGDADEAVLTWPEGNAWLARRMAEPLGAGRLHLGRVAWRVAEGRSEVTVDLHDAASGAVERWTAPQVVVALPLFVAARVVERPPAALLAAAGAMRHAPWLVANLHLAEPLAEHPGAPLSWDNVVYRGADPAALGYVDAMHQSVRTVPGPTVLTAYRALGGASPGELRENRRRLLAEPWSVAAAAVVDALAGVHPDLPSKLRRVDLTRYGHAMAIPAPGVRRSAALAALAAPQRRVHYAHADLSGYSVFEEALYQGTRAGRAAARGAAGAKSTRSALDAGN